MTKQFWATVVIIVLALVGVFAFTNKNKDGSNTTAQSKPTQHIIGEGKKGVTLVEYGDYQCPYCQAYEPTVEQVQKLYEKDMRFQFRHFPIVSAHPNAFAAARAAEAASLQNKFWEMHRALYAPAAWQQWTSSSSPMTIFSQLAQQLGLDVNKFKTDYASDTVNKSINADLAEARKLDVNSTPTFFINGKQVKLNNSVEAFKKAIDAEIAKQKPNPKQ